MAEFEQGLHLLDSPGQGDQHGCGAVGGEAVAFVGFEFFFAPQNVEIGDGLLQGFQQLDFINVRQRAVEAFVIKNVHLTPSSLDEHFPLWRGDLSPLGRAAAPILRVRCV